MEKLSQSLDISESLPEQKEVGDNMVKAKSEKKTAKPAEKKAPKKEDEGEFDDDFDDESDLGLYLFWAVVIVIAAILALWLFTDWQFCIQF